MSRTCPILMALALLLAGRTLTAAEPPGYTAKAEVANGLQAILFTTPAGVIGVSLPDDLRPGDTISGTISLAPSGATAEARAANATMLGRHTVEFGPQRSPVNSPTMRWTLPSAAPSGGIALALKNDQGAEVARTMVSIATKADGAAQAFHLPEIGQTGRTFEIAGPFDGDFSTTQLQLDKEALDLVAESPRKLIARNSYAKSGMALLVLRERDRAAEMDFRSVAVNLAAPTTALLTGAKTTLTVRLTGLEGLAKPVSLLLENTSADVITLSGGNTERFRIKPSDVAAGSVTIERTVTGIKAGSWTISCSVVKDE